MRVGLIPGNGGCYFLPRIVGVARALELLMTGEFVGADEALRIGLVNQVYDDDKFLDRPTPMQRKSRQCRRWQSA